MHGKIFVELQRYVETAHGVETWEALLQTAGLEDRGYEVLGVFPDEKAVALVTAAACEIRRDEP